MMEPIIEIKGLACQSGKRYLLTDIDWSVEPGGHWAVFGLNGSGKTTLLSTIAGFKKFTQGSLKVLGQAYDGENILKLRSRIGLVSSSFFDRYYGREQVLDIVLSGKFGAFGLRGEVCAQEVVLAKALLKELHLADFINRPYDLLSRGEKQNVLIARALFARPDILLLDEPCTGLDIANRAHLLGTVRDLAEQTAMTIIYVTHYTDELLDCFDQTVLLRNGRIYAQGPTEALFTEEVLTPFLGQRAKVTFAPGAITVKLETTSQVCRILEGGERDGS